jgi:hypothetical protein
MLPRDTPRLVSRRPPREVARTYSSRALVDTTCVLSWTPVSGLRALLRPLGLELAPTHGAPRNSHPIWIDLGYIKSGAGEALDLDQHAWWRRTAEAAGGAWGWASGAWAIGAMNASTGAFTGIAEQFSRQVSRTLGSYQEILIAVPNVVASRTGGGPYAFVLGMFTNSPIAIWGDQALRYGYQKRFCRLDGQLFHTYAARDSTGATLLSAEITIPKAHTWRPARRIAGLAAQLRLTSQPLLGHLGQGRFALSLLERDYLEPEQALVVPSQVALSAAPDLMAGLAATESAVAAIGRRSPWGAFSVNNVPTRVTYPVHVSLADL